jgi:hypothetical protein
MFGAIFVAVGILMLGIWLVLRKKSSAAAQWPKTRGRILSSAIQRDRDSDGEYQDVLRLTYEYAVAGGMLRGDRVSISGSGSGSSKAKLARYPAGEEVDVFYDPKKPTSAVLECKLPGSVIVLPIVGAFFVVIGAVAAVAIR